MSESGIKILATNDGHYVDWQSIIAGSFIAAAISLVFLAFGSGLGLSLTSFQTDGPHPRTAILIAAAIWLLWVQISSFVGGGYIAGRLRRRIGDAERHEIEMRDGAHGLTVWAVAVVFGSLLAGWLTLTSVSGATKAAATFSTDYYVDKMLRSDAASSTPGSLNSASDNSQISRVIAQTVATKSINDSDKNYVVQQIATRSGLSPADSEKRLSETIATLQTQAESARKYAVLIAFLTAASLLISAVAAWWGAIAGGKHRDDAIDHSHLTIWR